MEKKLTKLSLSYTQTNGDKTIITKTFEGIGLDIFEVRDAFVCLLIGAGFQYETILEILPEDPEIKFEG